MSMIRKGKNSLSCLKMSICTELRSLHAHSASHKKGNLNKNSSTPVRIASKMSESIISSETVSKDSASLIKHIVNKTRKEAKCKITEMHEATRKIQKLKKMGYKNAKEQQAKWQLSCTSTKCNDSKVEGPSSSLIQLLKQNKQYQQTISHQKQLILKLERIIDEMC